MQVRHDEGVATRIGPELCAAIREGGGEASAGERIGQPLSHESSFVPSADAVTKAEGNTAGRASASARDRSPRDGQRTRASAKRARACSGGASSTTRAAKTTVTIPNPTPRKSVTPSMGASSLATG